MNATASARRSAIAVLAAALAVPALAYGVPSPRSGLAHPVHARFYREVRRADEFAFHSMSVFDQEVDVSSLRAGRPIRVPAEYSGSAGGLLAVVACLSGLKLTHPGADQARFEEPGDGEVACAKGAAGAKSF